MSYILAANPDVLLVLRSWLSSPSCPSFALLGVLSFGIYSIPGQFLSSPFPFFFCPHRDVGLHSVEECPYHTEFVGHRN